MRSIYKLWLFGFMVLAPAFTDAEKQSPDYEGSADKVAEELAARPIACNDTVECPRPFRCYQNEICGGCNEYEDCPSNTLVCKHNVCRSRRKYLSCLGKPGIVDDAVEVLRIVKADTPKEVKGCNNVYCRDTNHVCVRRGVLRCVPYLESHYGKYDLNIQHAVEAVGRALIIDPKACNDNTQCPERFKCFDGFCGGCKDDYMCPSRNFHCLGNICIGLQNSYSKLVSLVADELSHLTSSEMRFNAPNDFRIPYHRYEDQSCAACISDKDCEKPKVCEGSICKDYDNTNDYQKIYNAEQVAEQLAANSKACNDTYGCPKPFHCHGNVCGGCKTNKDCPTTRLLCIENICRSLRSFLSGGRKKGVLKRALDNLRFASKTYENLPEHRGCENVTCAFDYECQQETGEYKCIPESNIKDDVRRALHEINYAVADVGDALVVDPKACNETKHCPNYFQCVDGFCGGCKKRTDCPTNVLNCSGYICQNVLRQTNGSTGFIYRNLFQPLKDKKTCTSDEDCRMREACVDSFCEIDVRKRLPFFKTTNRKDCVNDLDCYSFNYVCKHGCHKIRSFYNSLDGRHKGALDEALVHLNKTYEAFGNLPEQKGCQKIYCPRDFICSKNREGTLECLRTAFPVVLYSDRYSEISSGTDFLSFDVVKGLYQINMAIAKVGDALIVDPKPCNEDEQCRPFFKCFRGFCGGCNKLEDCPTNELSCVGLICRRSESIRMKQRNYIPSY